MDRFRNILVGVDLADSDRIVSCEISPVSRVAIDKGIWLAKETGARLTFLSAMLPCLDVGPDAFDRVLQPHLADVVEALRVEADTALQKLVDAAHAEGVDAVALRTCGTSWVEVIRAVTEHDHDLVIVGSHKRHAWGRILLGSTGQKLLRKCPCPVWVVSPHENAAVKSILLAHDFTETSDLAAELALSLAELLQAQLHVLHTVEYPHELTYKVANIPLEYLTDYRFQVYREAKQEFDDMLARSGLERLVDVDHRHLLSGHAANVILDVVTQQKIDLVVMGTVGRSGLQGAFLGNVAESVLPNLTCSVLAVKPRNFVCPIRFTEELATAPA